MKDRTNDESIQESIAHRSNDMIFSKVKPTQLRIGPLYARQSA